MQIKKGQTFTVRDKIKGSFKAVALQDFDTETWDFYPVATLEQVSCMTFWMPGEEIPCWQGSVEIVLND